MVIKKALHNFDTKLQLTYGYHNNRRMYQLRCMRTGMS